MNGAIVRIVLRYLAGFIVGAGIATPELAHQLATDPDVILILTGAINWTVVATGSLVGIVVEWFYAMAKRLGWAT